jgi:S1-C subfamily serine protease
VTRGVVSAWRPARLPEQPYDLIQADVAIHGGNSGGPLMDRHGNVVGIAVLGWRMNTGQRNSSLNGFIPILDGLDKLGLDLTDPGVAGRRQRVSATQ